MTSLPDFQIHSTEEISRAFLSNEISTFHAAIEFVRNLPYGRNSNKDDLTTVFIDNRATCSTKHALLKKLIDENEFPGIELIVGIYKMNARNTPKTARTLQSNNLDYIPEAHVYLKYSGERFDFTHRNSTATAFENDLMSEQTIDASQINQPKIELHKAFLKQWLNDHPEIPFSLDEIWRIREQCIQDLSVA
jgi:hypothetical protein